ncbi:MAG: quinone-dependent dihydroorotate dehydrogenase [Alphaproteobacteria bacterium]|nr:quinone-dependent dihydroorotate dehydrogenase [Alphaproteobacteria bacterium]
MGLPLLRLLDAETAHRLTIQALRVGIVPPPAPTPPERLAVRAFGLRFPSPVGLAAGFDKDAEVPRAMLRVGFGFVEVGTITPKPQAGNPRPRIFRLTQDRAVINRLGFNNKGLEAARARLTALRNDGARAPGGIVAVNIGANRDAADPVQDYATCIRALAPLADLLVLNISSPNTPGLRDLHVGARLDALLAAAMAARIQSGVASETRPGDGPPVLVKIAPDLTEDEVGTIVDAAISGGAAGLIVGNTTIGLRDALRGPHRNEKGGLSGRPLMARSTEVLAQVYRAAGGRLTLIGTGGVSSGADAYAKIRAGATLVELYTALVYEGTALLARIHAELAELLARDGFSSIAAAVGADHRR